MPDDLPESDEDLLRAYAREGSQNAFRRIVERHQGLVTGVVRRQVDDAGAAEEAVQNVFALLARKARTARASPTLAGWLCRTALFESRRARRRAAQTLHRMQKLMNHTQTSGGSDADSPWGDALPHLDKAMADLSPADRDLLLLRFHERRSFRDIGERLGKSEDASQKQAERALEKLGRMLRRRGVTLGVAALSTGLASALPLKSHAAAQDVALRNIILTRRALEAAPDIGRLTLMQHTIETMDHPKTAIFVATLLLAALPLGLLWQDNRSLRTEMASLRSTPAAQQAGSLQPAPEAPQRPSAQSGRRSTKPALAVAEPVIPDWVKVLDDPDPVRRAAQFHAFLAALTPNSAMLAAESLTERRNGDRLKADEWKLFLRAWAGLDGEAALTWIDNLSENVVARSGGEREAALAGWAAKDARGAQAWVSAKITTASTQMNMQQPFAFEELIHGVAQGMGVENWDAGRDYLAAQAVAGNVQPGRAANWILQSDIACEGTAAGLLARLPADDAHREIRAAILGQTLANRQTEEAVALATRWQHELSPESLTYAANGLAGGSAPRAMDWIDDLASVKAGDKGQARAAVIATWACGDPDAAGAWLNAPGRREDPAYNDAAASYAKTTAGFDPAGAVAWARTIADPQQQHDTLVAMAQDRLTHGDQEAVEVLRAAGVTDEEIAQQSTTIAGWSLGEASSTWQEHASGRLRIRFLASPEIAISDGRSEAVWDSSYELAQRSALDLQGVDIRNSSLAYLHRATVSPTPPVRRPLPPPPAP